MLDVGCYQGSWAGSALGRAPTIRVVQILPAAHRGIPSPRGEGQGEGELRSRLQRFPLARRDNQRAACQHRPRIVLLRQALDLVRQPEVPASASAQVACLRETQDRLKQCRPEDRGALYPVRSRPDVRETVVQQRMGEIKERDRSNMPLARVELRLVFQRQRVKVGKQTPREEHPPGFEREDVGSRDDEQPARLE